MLSELKFADRATTELSKHFRSSESYCNQSKKVHKKFVISMSSKSFEMPALVMNALLHKKAGFMLADEVRK